MNLKEQYKRLFEGKIASNDSKLLKEGIENKIPGLMEFLLFKSIMDTRTVKRADDEDQRRWADVTEDLDDTLTRWMDLLQELDKTYPS